MNSAPMKPAGFRKAPGSRDDGLQPGRELQDRPGPARPVPPMTLHHCRRSRLAVGVFVLAAVLPFVSAASGMEDTDRLIVKFSQPGGRDEEK